MAGWILDQIYYRTKDITGNKGGHYMIIKGSIHQEDIILNLYAPNNRNTSSKSDETRKKENWPLQ